MKEREAYIYEGKRAIWSIFPSLCKGCGLCMERCPVEILVWSENLGAYATPMPEPRDPDECTGCGNCMTYCPDCAILVERLKKKKE